MLFFLSLNQSVKKSLKKSEKSWSFFVCVDYTFDKAVVLTNALRRIDDNGDAYFNKRGSRM
jgi:hypothetical protein